MASWTDIATDSLRAAETLRTLSPRSALSRLYYAFYALATQALLDAGVTAFGSIDGRPRRNPPHDALPKLLVNALTGLTLFHRRQLAASARVLRHLRESTDYRPGWAIDQAMVLEAFREVRYARGLLRGGVP